MSFLSFCVVCCRIHVRSFWPRGGRRWFPNTKKSSVLGQLRAEKVRCYSNISAGLHEKHKQAIFAKNNGWSSGSSPSSGGEQRKPRDQEEEIKQLRAQVELLQEATKSGEGLEA